jgi:hypothetical protein
MTPCKLVDYRCLHLLDPKNLLNPPTNLLSVTLQETIILRTICYHGTRTLHIEWIFKAVDSSEQATVEATF